MAQFSLDISAFVQKAKARQDLVVRKIGLEVLSRIVYRSPVKTGRFRGAWMVSLNTPMTATPGTLDAAGGATIERGNQAMMDVKVGDTIWLINSLPYANRIEHGWSQQAPAGVVGITVVEFQNFLSKAVSEAKQELP